MNTHVTTNAKRATKLELHSIGSLAPREAIIDTSFVHAADYYLIERPEYRTHRSGRRTPSEMATRLYDTNNCDLRVALRVALMKRAASDNETSRSYWGCVGLILYKWSKGVHYMDKRHKNLDDLRHRPTQKHVVGRHATRRT